jgi:hypothetical protein
MMPPVRWVLRKEKHPITNYPDVEIQYLQYWHESNASLFIVDGVIQSGEWRDVPIVRETV